MQPLAASLLEQIPPLYSTENLPLTAKTAVCKLFTPDANWTWYVCEYDPASQVCFGFVVGLEREWGYFSLKELESIRGPLGLPIELDIHFQPQPIAPLLTME